MALNGRNTPNLSNQSKEVLFKTYEVAITLIQYNISLLWQEFNVFLLAETVLLGFMGTALTGASQTSVSNWLITSGSIFGILLCILWSATYLHNYKYYILRIEQAKVYEKELGIALIIDGGKLSSGQTLSFDNNRIRFPYLARILPPRCSMPILIGLFALAYRNYCCSLRGTYNY